MMKLLKFVIWRYLYMQLVFYKWTKTGSFGIQQAQYLENIDMTDANPLKQALVRYHVKQYHEASCSVASVASLVNAVTDIEKQTNSIPVSQLDLLENVKEAHWKERMEPEGHNGRRGLPLSVFGDVVKNSFEVYELRFQEIDVVQANQKSDEAEIIKEKLRARLIEYETGGNALIIAHFNQGIYLKTLQIPHISPVGGYDPETDMVTILDVDYLQKNHYQISFDRFYEGLANNYNRLFRAHGFDSGGYVYIKLQ